MGQGCTLSLGEVRGSKHQHLPCSTRSARTNPAIAGYSPVQLLWLPPPRLPLARWWCTITAVRSPRWPATAPPPCGGDRVHGRRLLTVRTHLTLELVRITAYPCGLALQLALTATGRPARRALHQTRPLTDPADPSAQWSYLDVWAGTDDLAVADPYFPRPDLHATATGICTFRSEPLYWLPAPARTVTLTAEWPQIGLPASLTTLDLAAVAPSSTHRPP